MAQDGERGTWVPKLTGIDGGIAVLSSAFGTYARSGNIVHASARIVTSSTAGLSGQLCIDGLPIGADMNPDYSGRNAAPLSFWAGLSLPASGTIMGFLQDPTRIRLYYQTSSSGMNLLTPSRITGKVTIYISVTYICHDPLPFELTVWEREAAPIISPPGGSVWDGASIYDPNLVRNLDRTPYRDANGDLYLYYLGDNTSPGDLDEAGLFRGPDLDNLTKVSVSAPVMGLGPNPSPDAGDVQFSSCWHDGEKFIIYYAGNALPPGSGNNDQCTLCMATSVDGVNFTRHGIVLDRGPGGDAQDHYWHRLVSNAPGGPRIYYSGKDADTVFGLMCAVSTSGSVEGPWVRLSNSHLFGHYRTVVSDAWYEDGLYHFLYTPFDDVTGIVYATSVDGINIDVRREVFPRNPGSWDEHPYHASWFEHCGKKYLLFNSRANVGIGYASA